MAGKIKVLETFRDAIQGLDVFIPTAVKVELINMLLDAGFDYVDAGSFVSPRIIPQFSDMEVVLEQINEPGPGTNLFVLAASKAGAERAVSMPKVQVVGFPFSTSETFLHKNINQDFDAAWRSVCDVQDVCTKTGRDLMVYLAMAFGNPYNDPVHVDICLHWSEKLKEIGVRNIHLSDITGVATPQQVGAYFCALNTEFPGIQWGIHLHTGKSDWRPKIEQAYLNGCHVFDGVISGLGGCPMTGYEMIANLPTAHLIGFAKEYNLITRVAQGKFDAARNVLTDKLSSFSSY